MILNEYEVKLCLEHEVKKGNKVVRKELIVALRSEIYFVKFIINPEEDDVEPRVIFGRSFLHMTKAITDFGVGTITIYHNIDPFLEETKEKRAMINGTPYNKRAMENLNFFYQDIGTSSSAACHLTQEEAAKEAIAIRMSRKFALLDEERPIIETMTYHEKYKKILDEIWKDKVELDGKIVKEEEDAVKRIKGEALKEKDDPGAFIFPITLEGHINENGLADIGLDINTMPYQIYETLGREYMKKVDRGITMINHTQAEAIGILTNVLCQVGVTTLIAKFLILDIPIDHESPIVVGQGFLRTIGGITMGTHDDEAGSSRSKRSRQHETMEEVLLPQVHNEFLLWEGCNRDAKSREIDDMLRTRLHEAGSDEEIFTYVAWIRAFNINEPIYAELCHEFYSTYEIDKVCTDDELQTKKIIKLRLGGRAHSITFLEVIHKMITYSSCQRTTMYDKIQKNDLWLLSMFDARHQNGVLTKDVVRSLSTLIYCRDLDMITLRDLIDSDGKLISEDPQPGVPRVGIPRPLRASMQDLYDRIGRMEIRQEAIERMEYRQSYH
nr:retrotransposon Orf1 [Tanacetum cinerariifolium]